MATNLDRKKLFLLFESGGSRYAIDSAHVVEVLPRIALQESGAANGGGIGRFTYRGQAIPAVDMSELLGGDRSADLLSTRIVVVSGADAQARLLGLIVEHAVRLARVAPGAVLASDADPHIEAFVGNAADHKAFQVVRVAGLVPPELARRLFGDAGGGAP